jgi:hypothetical protein
VNEYFAQPLLLAVSKNSTKNVMKGVEKMQKSNDYVQQGFEIYTSNPSVLM